MSNSKGPNPKYVQEFEVHELFGKYCYHLENLDDTTGAGPPLTVLYGPNGSGKTTILKLLFHLLSTAPRSGHFTSIARIPFSKIRVTLSDRSYVEAVRNSDLVGSFLLRVHLRGRSVESVEVKARSRDHAVPGEQADNYEDIRKIIEKFNLSTMMLADDRTFESDMRPDEDRYLQVALRQRWEEVGEASELNRRDAALLSSLRRVRHWIREKQRRETFVGEASAPHAYAAIIKRVKRHGLGDAERKSRNDIVHLLHSIRARSKDYARYHLVSVPDTDELLEAVANADPDTFAYVADIATAYVESFSARLDALKSLRDLLERFHETCNQFFDNKEVRLDVRHGVQILYREKPMRGSRRLHPMDLSSGEKHLLLILVNALTSRDDCSLFIMDEPELSLNVKWQRQLVDALQTLSQDSPGQFILATHSMELLTRHHAFVRNLEPLHETHAQ